METAVNKLEAVVVDSDRNKTAVLLRVVAFLKAECDLDYIEQKLEFEIRKSLPDNSVEQENPVKLLEELSLVKLRYKSLCGQMEKISAQQKETMDCMHTTLVNTIRLVQHLQHQVDFEQSPLSEEEKAAVQKLEDLNILVDA